MKYFPRVPNIYINADGYLDGFLGLRWFPSGGAKQQVDMYERHTASVLFKLWGRSVSAAIMKEIGSSRKRVDIVPHELAPDAFPRDTSNAFTGPSDPDDWKHAMKKGTEGNGCMLRKSETVAATGAGAAMVVSFSPFAALDSGPGGSVDEILLHELIHAMRYVNGAGTACYGAPPGFDGKYEEFVAVLLTNVYCSSVKRPLRRNLEGFKPMGQELSEPSAFLQKYSEYVKPLRSAHPHLYVALQKAKDIAFNPFALM